MHHNKHKNHDEPTDHLSHASKDPLHPFADSELRFFQEEDKTAGRAVILLMSCVFLFGLVGSYIIFTVTRG